MWPKFQTTAARGPGAFGDVEHPSVCAKRLVKPNGVIEACEDEPIGEEAMAVSVERTLEQPVVARIREHGLMHDGVIVEFAVRAKPHALRPAVGDRLEKIDVIDLPTLDRSVQPKQEAYRWIGRPPLIVAQPVVVAGYGLGPRRIRHRPLVLETFLGCLERDRHVEDRPSALVRNHTPSRKGASVTNPIDVVDHGTRRIAFTKEVPVERMREPSFNGATRGDERLRGDEPTEDPRSSVLWTETTVEIGVDFLEIESLEEAAEIGHAADLAWRTW